MRTVSHKLTARVRRLRFGGLIGAIFVLKFHFKNAEFKLMTEQEKAYISLNKYFLALQHKLTKYKMAGHFPPEYLLKRFEDTKRRLRIFSKARKN